MTNQLVEYIKLHRLSLNQDLDKLEKKDNWNELDELDYKYLIAQVGVLDHILQYADEIDKSLYEGV